MRDKTMNLAERIYRNLLWLFPASYRRDYERLMLQHASDMGCAAEQRGRWHVAKLCLRLLKDGISNAGIEHMEAIMMGNYRSEPVPWLSVLLASLPGLLLALDRSRTALLDPLLPILGYFYLGLLVFALPIHWWKSRQFPVWALLPAGLLAWELTYLAGVELAEQIQSFNFLDLGWIGIETGRTLLQILLATAIFWVLLRGQRLSVAFWGVIGVIVFGNLILATLFSFEIYGGARLVPGILKYFITSGVGSVEGLMLIAVGLLAVRQHGVLALLVVVGGYSYWLHDSDYFSAFRFREWVWLPWYLVAVTILYLGVMPIAFLRASTRLGRALAVFLPMVVFHAARLTIPLLVIEKPISFPWGDVVLSANFILNLIMAWILYSRIDDASRDLLPDDQRLPIQYSIS